MTGYTVTFVGRGEIVKQRKCRPAPGPDRLVKMAPGLAEYAIRYYPSIKVYRVYRVIDNVPILVQGMIRWKPDLAFTTPNEDAAILWAIFQSSRK